MGSLVGATISSPNSKDKNLSFCATFLTRHSFCKMKKESHFNHRSAEQKCWQFLVLSLLLNTATNALPITTTTPQPPPVPFKYSYEAGRAANGKPARYVEQEGDGTGKVRGSYTYLDPNWTWQTIKYVADPDGGFRIMEGSTLGLLPKDTAAVQKAKAEHDALFQMIAQRNSVPPAVPVLKETKAVQNQRRQHAALFQKIAEEHRLLAEEHKRLERAEIVANQ